MEMEYQPRYNQRGLPLLADAHNTVNPILIECHATFLFRGRDPEDLTELVRKLLDALPAKQHQAAELIYYQQRMIIQAIKAAECSQNIFYNCYIEPKRLYGRK